MRKVDPFTGRLLTMRHPRQLRTGRLPVTLNPGHGQQRPGDDGHLAQRDVRSGRPRLSVQPQPEKLLDAVLIQIFSSVGLQRQFLQLAKHIAPTRWLISSVMADEQRRLMDGHVRMDKSISHLNIACA